MRSGTFTRYPCAVEDLDTLRLDLDEGETEDAVTITCIEDGELCVVVLSKEDARNFAMRILVHLEDP